MLSSLIFSYFTHRFSCCQWRWWMYLNFDWLTDFGKYFVQNPLPVWWRQTSRTRAGGKDEWVTQVDTQGICLVKMCSAVCGKTHNLTEVLTHISFNGHLSQNSIWMQAFIARRSQWDTNPCVLTELYNTRSYVLSECKLTSQLWEEALKGLLICFCFLHQNWRCCQNILEKKLL